MSLGHNPRMFQLKNKLDKAACLARLAAEDFERVTLSFYRYVPIENVREFRDSLFAEWSELGVFGRVYLASEGINAQISVPAPRMDDFRAALNACEELAEMYLNIAVEQESSFYKLTMKIKDQIVADNLEEGSYDLQNPGRHLNAEEWNGLMDAGATVVDMRNFYESRIGHFEGAICPDVDTFKEELPMVREMLAGKEEEEVLLYCTGGIRCEKASAYLKHHGFKKVNQLKGGIISYSHEVQEKGLESKFKGSNFVFDERLSERITEDILSECDQCGRSEDRYVNCANKACNLLFIQCESCSEKMHGACTPECVEIALLPAAEQKAHYAAQKPARPDGYRSRIRPAARIHNDRLRSS